EGVRTQPGARELVEHLHALGARQAIASSAPPANIDLMVQLLGLPFDAVVSGEEVARGKPAPDIFLRAAERLDLPPARVVVLEDAPAGVEAGKAAGSRVIAIAATFPACVAATILGVRQTLLVAVVIWSLLALAFLVSPLAQIRSMPSPPRDVSREAGSIEQ